MKKTFYTLQLCSPQHSIISWQHYSCHHN